jgi:hypothetical protein
MSNIDVRKVFGRLQRFHVAVRAALTEKTPNITDV